MPLALVLVVLVAAATGILVLGWIASLANTRHIRLVLFAVLLLLTAGGTFYALAGRTLPLEEHQITSRPIQVDDRGYVSSESCRSCHPGNHDSWFDSYHRTMTQVEFPEAALGNFDNVYLELYGDSYRLFRDGDRFLVDMVDPDWKEGDPPGPDGNPPRETNQMVMTTGSHHMQVYWYAREDKARSMGQFPFVWMIEDQEWIPRFAAFLMPAFHNRESVHSESGRWNVTCINCHSTAGVPRIQKAGQDPHAPAPRTREEMVGPESTADTQVADFGIACEACHGPGREHIEVNQDPLRRYRLRASGEPDPTIINPARLDAARGSQVCGQCHATSEREDWSSWAESGWEFTPGDDLHDNRTVMMRENFDDPWVKGFYEDFPQLFSGMFWPDGTVRVAGREYNGLVDSPCFKADSHLDQLSCMSCHSMHQASEDPRPRKEWANDQLAVGMDGNEACTQCHSEYADTQRLQAHTHHAAGSGGSECYNCHMPHTTYGLLKAIRSHTIESPDVAVSHSGGRPNACNQCHLDKSLGWTAEHLESWYGIDPPFLDEYEQSVPASILWAYSGDAAARALSAWSFGWEEAHAASGNEWIGAFLPQLLLDPYNAVRYITYHSLRTLPGYEDFDMNIHAPVPVLQQAAGRAIARHTRRQRELGHPPGLPALLYDPGGLLGDDQSVYAYLLQQRDNSIIFLAE